MQTTNRMNQTLKRVLIGVAALIGVMALLFLLAVAALMQSGF